MVLLPDDERGAPLLPGACHQPLDTPHIGTGCVHHLRAQRLQLLIDLPRLAVGADDDRLPRPHLRYVVHLPGAQRLQILHHMGVVDDAAQHDAASLFAGGLLRQLHRTLHAVAEPGGLCQDHRHDTPPSS